LPDVFVDGDSIDLYDTHKGTVEQVIRPYAMNAEGAQQLKNLAGQSLANQIEGVVQSKFILKKEAIPTEQPYLNSLTNYQVPNVVVVNAFIDNDPNKPIPEPITPIIPTPIPPEITTAITMADQIIQNELGSYDAQLGINDNQLSGIAIQEAATQSNATAMPYVVNYLCALNQIALIIVDLIPKYYKTPMSIPIIDKEGNRSAIKINGDDGIDFNYDSNILKVKVTAGVNFSIQKSRALQQIIAMCQASPIFAEFMNVKGLKVLLDNFEIRGIDILKKLAEEFQQELEAKRKSAEENQAAAMQNDPRVIDAQTKKFKAESEAVLAEKKIELEEEKIVMQRDIAEANKDASMARAHAEEIRANADLLIETKKMHHTHGKETLETLHKITREKEDAASKREKGSK
jgi:hypothetical protein